MTVAKDIRVPSLMFSRVVFKETLSVFATDVLELDFQQRKARVTNRAGKVKAVTSFVAEADGQSTTAGS